MYVYIYMYMSVIGCCNFYCHLTLISYKFTSHSNRVMSTACYVYRVWPRIKHYTCMLHVISILYIDFVCVHGVNYTIMHVACNKHNINRLC